MAYRDLPMLQSGATAGQNGHSPAPYRGQAHEHGTGQVGEPGSRKPPPRNAAVANPRDAYHDVPILQRPPWGHWIAEYFFFGGISSGAFAIGTVAALAGERRRDIAHAAYLISFATVLPCPVCLIADLGRPARFMHMLRIFKPSSPMNLGAWTLVAHSGFVTLAAAASLARMGRLPLAGPLLRPVPLALIGAPGLPFALTLGGYTGVLLGTTSIPVWYTSPLLGALFMASSLSTGVAATALVGAAVGAVDEGHYDALAPLGLGLNVAEIAILGGYLATSGSAARPLLRGSHGVQIAVAAGALLGAAACEVAAMLLPRQRRLLGAVGGAATLTAGALIRWSVVYAGHRSADDREGTLEAMSPSASSPGWQQSARLGS